MAFADQLGTLVAVLVCAAGSYIVVRFSERDRFARELKIRWDQRRLDACIAFMSAAKVTGTLANRFHERNLRGSAITDIEYRVEELAASDLRRAEAFELLAFLANASTIEAAHALNRTVFGLESPIRFGAPITEDEWHSLADKWIEAMNSFHEAARADLGVSGTFARRDVAALAVSRPERGRA